MYLVYVNGGGVCDEGGHEGRVGVVDVLAVADVRPVVLPNNKLVQSS